MSGFDETYPRLVVPLPDRRPVRVHARADCLLTSPDTRDEVVTGPAEVGDVDCPACQAMVHCRYCGRLGMGFPIAGTDTEAYTDEDDEGYPLCPSCVAETEAEIASWSRRLADEERCRLARWLTFSANMLVASALTGIITAAATQPGQLHLVPRPHTTSMGVNR